MYKIIVDDQVFEFSYEEMIQLFCGYVWTGSSLTKDEHWHSARLKTSQIRNLLPVTSY